MLQAVKQTTIDFTKAALGLFRQICGICWGSYSLITANFVSSTALKEVMAKSP